MKRRFLLFIMFILSIICFLTFVLVLNYVDPYEYQAIWLSALAFTYVLWFSSFLTLIIYFFKKIYYRGDVWINHVLNSFRQWFLISVFFLILVFFNYYKAPMLITAWLDFIVLFCLELFVKSQD